jgi:hypothetical protein
MGSHADEPQARFTVSVHVVPTARLAAVSSPESMLVTTQDLRRGIKTLLVRYRVIGNSIAGYLLHVVPHVGLTTNMVVRGLPGEVMVADNGTDVTLPPSAAGTELALEIELRLDPDATTGRYPLPLDFSLSPIPVTAG